MDRYRLQNLNTGNVSLLWVAWVTDQDNYFWDVWSLSGLVLETDEQRIVHKRIKTYKDRRLFSQPMVSLISTEKTVYLPFICLFSVIQSFTYKRLSSVDSCIAMIFVFKPKWSFLLSIACILCVEVHVSKMTLSDSYKDWDMRACVSEIKLVLCLLQNAYIFKTFLRKSRAGRDVTIVYFYRSHSPR